MSERGIRPGDLLPEPPAVPVIAFRADGKEWLVAFKLGDAINLIREQLAGTLSDPGFGQRTLSKGAS